MEPDLFGGMGAGPRRVSLVKLSAEIARAASAIGKIAVEGEVHQPKRGTGGAVWFTLRDRSSQVSVRCPASRVRRCRAIHGERVQVTGQLEYQNARGQLQLVADEVTPVGAGAVAAMIAEARHRLAADGLLARPRRPLPRLPRRVAVVCGTEAAVRKDIESVVAARFPGYPVDFVETNVSGAGAAEAVVRAVEALDERAEVDVIVLARGGGDATHLLPFSDEDLCRALCACTTPIVSAIGHDGDHPLCDDVADLRCGTPSIAAAAVIPDRAELESELARLGVAAGALLRRRADDAERRLVGLDRDRAVRAGVDRARQRLGRSTDRLALLGPERRLQAAAAQLCGARQRMDALDPVRVLERGYAVVRTAEGAVVREAAAVAPGTSLQVQLAKGSVRTTVDEVAS